MSVVVIGHHSITLHCLFQVYSTCVLHLAHGCTGVGALPCTMGSHAVLGIIRDVVKIKEITCKTSLLHVKANC
jgi:hypothetical protein